MNVKVKGIAINLGGVERIVPPLNLNALEQLQDRLANYKGGLDSDSVKTVKDAVYASLIRNYPEITKEDVGEIIDLENIHSVMEAVMDISGLKRKAIEDAEKLGEANPSQ